MSSRTGLRGAAIIIGLSLSLNLGCDADAEGELALNAPADAGVDVQSDATSGTLDSSAPGDASTAPENAIDAAVDGTEAPCGLASCVIEGSCVENLAANPDNPCQLCIVAISATEWSSAERCMRSFRTWSSWCCWG